MIVSVEVNDARSLRLVGWVAFSALACVAIVLSSWTVQTRLGAPLYWPWVLTGLQVLALWAAGATHWWGWLLGASVQPPWIVYAVMTEQLGFIPGCAVSAVVQVGSYLQGSRAAPERRAPRTV